MRISPRFFKLKLEGYAEKDKTSWVQARFIAMTAGNAQFYKKPLKHRDLIFDFEKSEVSIPTKEQTAWMDKHYGRKI